MAGLGRRSHYRKHLTDSVLNDLPEPKWPHERIAQIVGSRGGNFFDILVSPSSELLQQSSKELPPQCKSRLALLPTKFRKLVWVKRGDYVIVHCGDDDESQNAEEPTRQENTRNEFKTLEEKKEEETKEKGVRYMIQHVLYKEQVKHLKSKGLWPNVFNDDTHEYTTNSHSVDNTDELVGNETTQRKDDDADLDDTYEEDDISHDYLNQDDLLMNANTNRMAHLAVYDDSEEESSSDEESDDEEDDE